MARLGDHFLRGGLGLVMAAVCSAATADDRPPNVVFLLADDQRADCVAALGNPAVQTPHLDRLVARGFSFRNAYCLGANQGAVCTPSRNMLLSGRAYFRWDKAAEPDRPSLPASFNAAGYQTYHHGKRGNTAPALQALCEVDRYLDNDEADRRSGHPGRVIVDAAIDFLRTRDDRRPFMMYLAFASPHDPRVANDALLARYRREDVPLPANWLPLHPFDNGEMEVRDERLAGWPRTDDELRHHWHEYCAVISGLDAQIGRLLAVLDELGETERTIVVFSSDHGLAMGSHGLMGKQSLYEHSMKAPLVFAGPGIPHGESDALVYLLDIYPTLCELAGAEVPAGIDGHSLAGVIAGSTPRVRETLGLAYRDVQRAVRDERWKLIRYPQIDRTQLFDLATDPDERHDVSGLAENAAAIARLTQVLRAWQADYGDACPWVVDEPGDGAWTPPGE